MAQHGHLSWKEKREIRKKRRWLRKDLKKRGIRDRNEFELMAQELGYVYDGWMGLLWFWWWLLDKLGLGALLLGALALLALLLGILGYANLLRSKDNFTIALSGDLGRVGFVLSETEDFEDPRVRLVAKFPENDVNPISMIDLPTDLDEYEGSHNGEKYMAYTFWARNEGEKMLNYRWSMDIAEVTKNIDGCTWVMIYQEVDTNDDNKEHDMDDPKETYDGNDRNWSDRVATMYAAPTSDGQAEHLSGYSNNMPILTASAFNSTQKYTRNGTLGIRTVPFQNGRTIASGVEYYMWPKEVHKYTVVMWVEGDDPECINDTLGGLIRSTFQFAVADDPNGLFDDFVNTEDDYYQEMIDRENAGLGNKLHDAASNKKKKPVTAGK